MSAIADPTPARPTPAALTIREVCASTGLTSRTLRFWEGKGLITAGRLGDAGVRTYDAAQLRRLNRVIRLRRIGLSVDQVRDFLALEAAGDDGAPLETRKRMLAERDGAIAAELDRLQAARRALTAERFALHFARPADDAEAAAEDLASTFEDA